MASDPGVTVVVPVKNGAVYLPALLARLKEQRVAVPLEVLAIDSESSDGSAAILERADVRTLRIPAASFDHGETRNLGAREARGRLVVFLTQDALPADEHVVQRLVDALDADPRVAGAFARQVARPEADPLTRRDLGLWLAAAPEPRTVFARDSVAFDAQPPLSRYALSAFDNVASVVRRDLLLAHPFHATRFGEDVEWGQRMLRLGHGLTYAAEALVIHSHVRTVRALYRRNYLGHRLLWRLFGVRTIPDRAHLLRAALGTVAGDLRFLARLGGRPPQFLAAPMQAWASVYGQYRGARDEALGRAYPEWAGR